MMANSCKYQYRDKRSCTEDVYPGSEFCILHLPLPDSKDADAALMNHRLKEDKIEEKADREDFNFEGTHLPEVDLFSRKIKSSLNFMDAVIENGANFDKAMIKGDVLFSGATIGGDLKFSNSLINGDAVFSKAFVGGTAWFEGCKMGCSSRFSGADIRKDARFSLAQISGTADFTNARIGGALILDEARVGGSVRAPNAEISGDLLFKKVRIHGSLRLDEANIGGDALFTGSRFESDVTLFLAKVRGLIVFQDVNFREPKAQENACRKAKQRYQEESDFENVDHYYYMEMEAKRKLKNWFKRIMELPVQYVFGYGTMWQPVMITWFVVVLGSALIYILGDGIVATFPDLPLTWWRYIYFSVATMTTLGFGEFHPVRGFEILAGFEAIFGTFIWAAFITIFARKYMR